MLTAFQPAHDPTNTTLPAGTAPKESTFQPNVGGELAPGQANNEALYDKEYSKPEAEKTSGSTTEKQPEEQAGEQATEISSATEKEPEVAGSY